MTQDTTAPAMVGIDYRVMTRAALGPLIAGIVFGFAHGLIIYIVQQAWMRSADAPRDTLQTDDTARSTQSLHSGVTSVDEPGSAGQLEARLIKLLKHS